MKDKHSKASKVLCGCCSFIAAVLLVVVILALYAFLYVPAPDKLLKKIDGKDNITAVYYENLDSASITAIAMVDTLTKITNLDTENISIIELYEDTEENEDGAYGIIIFTDSIGSSMGAMIDYIKFIMDQDSSDFDFHVSARGKAILFGNAAAEIELRKVIF